jgi:8-oxo-dGTP pyrophosphatase MutT (NUDIX family)
MNMYHVKSYPPRKEKKAGGIIINLESTKILLIKGRHSKKWGVPKGSMDIGESVRETAIREIREETGLSTEIDKYTIPVKIGKLYLYTVFVDERIPLTPIDSNEIMDIQWFSISSIKSLDTNTITVPFQKVTRYITNTFKSI